VLSGARVHSALDVGWGTGRFLSLLREMLGGAVLGVEPSEEFESGLATLRCHSGAMGAEGPVSEELDIFLFRR